jgi:LysR family nitrogen assimilation transcriptional regulator
VLHQVVRAEEAVRHYRRGVVGRVLVGLPPSIARAASVPLICAFRARHPDATLGISESPSAYLREWVDIGRLDACVAYDLPLTDDLEAEPLASEEVMLISSPRTPPRTGPRRTGGRRSISLRRVAGLPLIVSGRPHAMRHLVEVAFARIGMVPNIAIEVDGVVAVLELVRENLGHAILPQSALRSAPYAADLATCRIVEPTLRSQLSVVTSKRRPATAAQQALLRLLYEFVPAALEGRLKSHAA